MVNKITVYLLLITLLGLVLRLYHLATIPNGFFFDEATISYQAYSLIKTGHDTWNNFLPLLSFRDYGEYILPLGIYGQIPSILLGGLTVFAVRLPHAILGALTIPLVYLLGKNLLNGKVGLLACLFLATSPLSLGWSRFVFEGNFGTIFFLAGSVFFSEFLKTKRHLFWAIFFWGLSMLTYHVFLVITPLFVGLLIYFYRQKLTPLSRHRLPIILAVLFLLWSAAAIWSGAGRERFSQASNLITELQIDVLNHEIGYCGKVAPFWLCKLAFNKPILVSANYLKNYLEHFSPEFLTFDGTFLRRNLLPPSGILLLPEGLLFLAGIFFLLKNPKGFNLLPLAAMLIYPAANSFTGTGEISRIVFAAPFLSLVAAFGLWQITKIQSGFKYLVIPVYLLSLLIFLVNYFTVFPTTGAVYVDYGFDKVFSWLKDHRQKYDRIYISKNYSGSVPYISAMFFLPVEPKTFQQPGKVDRHKDGNNYFVTDRIGNYYFSDRFDWNKVTPRDFIVITPDDLPVRKINPKFEIIDPTGRKLLIGVEGSEVSNKKI